MKLLLQLLVNGLVNAAIYGMLAVGFGLVYRTTSIFHIAYGGIYVFAAYFFYVFASLLHIPVLISGLISVLLTAFLGFLIEKGVYLPFYKKRAGSGVVLIASLGLFIVMENLVAMVFGNEVKVVAKGIEPSFNIGPVVLTRVQLVELISGILAMGGFWWVIRKMKVFKAIWAMGDEPELVPVMGIPLFRLRALVFALSSAFAALVACMVSWDVGLDPHMGMSYLLIAVVAVIFGGIDSYAGWVIGALVLAELQSLAVWKFSARWMDLITFALLVLILLTRPQGLLGAKKRLEEQ